MTKKPTDREIIARAVELLESGILISELPAALMREFGLTAGRAWKLATEAVKRAKSQTSRLRK